MKKRIDLEQAVLLFKKGGRNIEPAIMFMLTAKGRDMYRVLTVTQRERWRSAIIQQTRKGQCTLKLTHYQHHRTVDSLKEWGAVEGEWVNDHTFRGTVPLDFISAKAFGKSAPSKAHKKAVSQKTEPVFFDQLPAESGVPNGVPASMLTTAVVLSMAVGIAVGAMFASL